MIRTRPRAWCVVIAFALAGASGCGGGGNSASSSTTPASGSASASSGGTTASSGGTSGGAASSPVASATTAASATSINGIPVPVDPGTAGKATVAGIDANANGIRDDLDRYLATRFGAAPGPYGAAQRLSRSTQAVLVADPAGSLAIQAALKAASDAGVCGARAFAATGADPVREVREIVLRTLNTPARLDAYRVATRAAGLYTRNVSQVSCP